MSRHLLWTRINPYSQHRKRPRPIFLDALEAYLKDPLLKPQSL